MNFTRNFAAVKIVLCGAFLLVELLSQSSISLAQGNTWTTKQDMPTARCNMASAVVDGKIYIVGGDGIFQVGVTSGLRTLEVYDPATDTWTSKTPMLVGNGYFGTGVVDGIIYTMGGTSDAYSSYSRVFAYDPSADIWSEKTAMPTARWGLFSCVVNGKFYAIGGTPGWPTSPLSTNEEYTPSITSVENKTINSPTSFVLHQNYPNPFNHVTTIEYAVQQSSYVKLKIYNTIGQIVRTLVDDYKTTGQYSVVWDGKDNSGKVAPSGIYFYEMKKDGSVSTKKMILME